MYILFTNVCVLFCDLGDVENPLPVAVGYRARKKQLFFAPFVFYSILSKSTEKRYENIFWAKFRLQ